MKKPLRVLVVSHSSSLSGAEQALLRFVTRLDRTLVDPIVVLPHEGPLGDELVAARIAVRILPVAWWIPATHWKAGEYLAQLEGLEARVAAMRQLVFDERIDLVHTNTIVTLEGAAAAAAAGIPHIWHSRGTFDGPFPPPYADWRFFMRAVDLLADEVICVSQGVARQAAEVCKLARLVVINDGMDIDAFPGRPVMPRAELVAKLGLDPSSRLIACIGGIQRRKRQRDLVDAMSMITEKHPSAIALLCGADTDPEYAASVDARIAELGLVSRVRRAGFWRDMRSLLAATDVVAHPSESEGFSLAVLEAMAAGVPVVATPSGPEEQLEHGVSGMIVPVGNARALADAIDLLLSDTARRDAIGQAAARRARDFDLSVTARRTEAHYAEVMQDAERIRRFHQHRARIADVLAQDVLTRARLAAR